MQVRLGKTQIIAEKNGFGALPIQRVSTEYAVKLARKAFDGGFNFFDTARAYTDSEAKLGIALKPVRDKLFIATKTAATTPEDFWEDLHTSLENLQTDYIDIYQLHMAKRCYRPDDGTGMYECMQEAKRQGKIRHIGITAHLIGVAEEIVESGLYETLQFPFCCLAGKRDIALVESCKRADMGFIAMKALSGGLITNSAAAYVWQSRYDNSLPIWGVQRETELDEFISYINNPPKDDDAIAAVIEQDRRELSGSFCRGCGYCMPCPMGIKINNCARMSQMIRRSPSESWLTLEWQAEMERITQCIHCNSCVKRCPYELNTPELLVKNLEDYRRLAKAYNEEHR